MYLILYVKFEIFHLQSFINLNFFLLCLKFYSAELNTKTLDVLKNRSIARYKFLDQLLDKGESIDDIENYDLTNY